MLEIIAEVGSTTNGRLEDALKLADAAKEAGADWIKYMLIGADWFMADRTQEYIYEWGGEAKTVNMYELFKSLEFTPDEWDKIVNHCQAIEMKWFLTVDYVPGIAFAEELGCPMYKLCAWDCRTFPLIRKMAATKKPMLIDLGPAMEDEIDDALACIKMCGDPPVTLLASTHSKDPNDANVATIRYLKQMFGCEVGWSSPGIINILDEYAVAAGAQVIEKRLTLNPDIEGHHNMQALGPEGFKRWVGRIRYAELCVGEYDIRQSAADLRDRKKYFTSIVANRDIPAGKRIEKDDLAAKRPGAGLTPLHLQRLCKKKSSRDIKENEYVRFDDVE